MRAGACGRHVWNPRNSRREKEAVATCDRKIHVEKTSVGKFVHNAVCRTAKRTYVKTCVKSTLPYISSDGHHSKPPENPTNSPHSWMSHLRNQENGSLSTRRGKARRGRAERMYSRTACPRRRGARAGAAAAGPARRGSRGPGPRRLRRVAAAPPPARW